MLNSVFLNQMEEVNQDVEMAIHEVFDLVIFLVILDKIQKYCLKVFNRFIVVLLNWN